MTDRASGDGSPIEAYALLPAEPELGVVRQLLGERRTVLDLGCGTGRIADPLAAESRDVVAVDESAAMLEFVQAATPVQGASRNWPSTAPSTACCCCLTSSTAPTRDRCWP